MPQTKVTPNEQNTGATRATIATQENATSTTYVDLATTTDTVTVTIGSNGLAFISLSAYIVNSAAFTVNLLSFVASGANTIAASDANGGQFQTFAANAFGMVGNGGQLLSGLTPGITTFKLKYRVTGGTGSYSNRVISVIPL